MLGQDEDWRAWLCKGSELSRAVPTRVGGMKDHRVPSSPTWQKGCFLRVQERLHPCLCFLGWLQLLYQ